MSVAILRVGDFLDALATTSPVPGGGSVVALEVALAAALVSMACGLGLRRSPRDDLLEGALARAALVRAEAVALADDDNRVYAALHEALALTRGDGSRAGRVEAALQAATDVPVTIAERAADVVRLCALVRERVSANVSMDVDIAASAGRAALEGAATLVHGNLAMVRDEGYARAARGRLAELVPA